MTSTLIAQVTLQRFVMFHSTIMSKKLKARRLSSPGLKLAWEEHKQECDQLHYLPVAQLQLERQFKHGDNLVCAGVHANWLRLAFVERPCPALALGLPRMALSGGLVGSGCPWGSLANLTLSVLGEHATGGANPLGTPTTTPFSIPLLGCR